MHRILRLFNNRIFVTIIWFGLSFGAILKQALHHHYNNYLIYKYTFINLVNQLNLYTPQPEHFLDTNHYGPLFALVIAPFTLLPDQPAVICWVLVNALVLYKAILMLPLTAPQKTAVLLICAHELMTASFNAQFNPIMAGIIVLTYVSIKNKHDFWAALLIMTGTYIKLYGIVGLAFFFFSEHKIKFTLYLVFWGVVLFLLPMLFSSPAYVVQGYYDWYASLVQKNAQNATSTMQDISVMGMIRRVFNYPQLSNLVVILPASVLFALSYINIGNFNKTWYQLLILASTLIFTVIFSTSSESPTYIIAFVGVAVWFMNLQRPVTGLEIFLLVFALIVTSLSPSDLFPKYINKTFIKPYALKALPCFLIWLRVVYDSLRPRDKDLKPSYQAV